MNALAESSGGTVKKRPRGRPFPKGVSGNPGGRPKIENGEELKEALKMLAPNAVEYMQKVLADPSASSAVKLQAAQAILDRCFGKPTQNIVAQTNVTFESALQESLEKARNAVGG